MKCSRTAIKKGLLAAGVSALALGVSATAQPPELEITKYRIQSDDCGLRACGMPEFQSQEEAIAFFAADRADRLALTSATSDGGYGEWKRGHKPFNSRGNQVVFLDFDAGGLPTFPVCFTTGQLFGVFNDYVYTQEDRDAIQARIEADYADFDYIFTQKEPVTGDFTTLSFGLNDAPLDCSAGSNIQLTPQGFLSILFGQAENIDFRNQSKNDNAFIDASLWAFLAQFNPGLLVSFTGLDPADFDNDLNALLTEAVTSQSANTGAHELGHIQGLRHHDSIGAPGDGLPTTGTPNPNDFIPVFDGPQNASETVLHVMASGASVGLPLNGSVVTNRFFSERSAIKLTLADKDNRLREEDTYDKRGLRDKPVRLLPLRVPNTLIEGENAGKRLNADGIVVLGEITETGEVDEYHFYGRAGKFINIEMVSFSDARFTNPVIGAMRLMKVNWDGSRTEVASNIQTFEPFDPLIFDQELPETGVYVVEVDAPNIVFFDQTGDGVPDPFPLDETGNGDLRFGDYELAFYSVETRLGRPPHRNFYRDRHPKQTASAE